MPRSSRNKTRSSKGMQPTSQKLETIDAWLQKMLDRFPSKGELLRDEIEDWEKDLINFSLEAIEFAFESHRRNAIFFPLPAQILDLCISYDPPVVNTTKCDAICRARHGKGYNEEDMKRLWGYVEREVKAGKKVDVEQLLQELDSKRPGGAPEFRREIA